MAKKQTRRKGSTQRRQGSGKRSLVKTKSDARYVKRTSRGRFKESDDVGRAARRDRPTKAKRKVKSGYGDRGDR
jgi:hypothetical protein